MGWTGYWSSEGTPKEIVIRAYEGRPLACADCGWEPKYHPRATGSEWANATDLPEPHEWRQRTPMYKVLDYARVGEEAYLAVQNLTHRGDRLGDRLGDVWAGICLVHTGGGETTIKEMSEEMGVGPGMCPDRLLDRLTPTDNETSNEWRQSCRDYNRAQRAARQRAKAIVKGTVIRFAKALTFTNGDTGDTFEYVEGSMFRTPGTYGLRYTIKGWRKLDYAVAVTGGTD